MFQTLAHRDASEASHSGRRGQQGEERRQQGEEKRQQGEVRREQGRESVRKSETHDDGDVLAGNDLVSSSWQIYLRPTILIWALVANK